MKKIWKGRAKLNNAGMTLAEQLVVFALLSLFMVSATMVISSVMNIYYQVRGVEYGQQVTNILIQKISGELANADAIDVSQGEAGMISFENRDGGASSFYLSTADEEEKQYLVLKYKGNKRGESLPDEEDEDLFEDVEWMYDKDVYMGYYLTGLTFIKPNQEIYGPDVIMVELTVKNDKYGEYTVQEYVKCYISRNLS